VTGGNISPGSNEPEVPIDSEFMNMEFLPPVGLVEEDTYTYWRD